MMVEWGAFTFGILMMGLLVWCCWRKVIQVEARYRASSSHGLICFFSSCLGITPGSKNSGAWDSIHVFEAAERGRTCHYKLTSTVILHLSTGSDTLGEMDLSGNMTRQIETDLAANGDESHVANVGRLVEDMEFKMRNLLRMDSKFYFFPTPYMLTSVILIRGSLFR